MKKLIVVAAIAAVAVVGWKVRSHKAEQTQVTVGDVQDGRNILVDQLWVDHLPRNERDPINVFVMLDEEKLGVMQNLTRYKGAYEMFEYGQGKGFRWPQTGDVDKPSIRIHSCKDDGFDYCMDISGVSRGVKHYVTKKDWKVRSLADEQALAAKLDATR
ncbi:MAG TPA: hypothetical protein VGG28_31015 [Kofleriaceae bacterium]|jgi:hypothetical protein